MGPRDPNVYSCCMYKVLIAIISTRIKTIITDKEAIMLILKGCEHAIDDKTCGSWRTYIFETPRVSSITKMAHLNPAASTVATTSPT